MLWVDTIFLITFSMYKVRIFIGRVCLKLLMVVSSNAIVIHFVWKLMIVSFMYHQTLVSHLPIISAVRDPPGTPQQRVTYMDTM